MSGGAGFPVTYVYDPPSPRIGITAVNGQINYDGEIGLGVAATTISGTVEGPEDVSVELYPQALTLIDPATGDASGQVQIEQTATVVPIATGITAADGNEIYDWTAVLPTGSLAAGVYQVAAFSGELSGYPTTELSFYANGVLAGITVVPINAVAVNLSVTPNTQAVLGQEFGLALGDQTYGPAAGELSSDGRYLLYNTGEGGDDIEVDLQTGAQYQVSGTPTLGSFGPIGTIPMPTQSDFSDGDYYNYAGTITSANGAYTYGAIAATTPFGVVAGPALFIPTVTDNATGDTEVLPDFEAVNATYYTGEYGDISDNQYLANGYFGIEGVPVSVSDSGNEVLIQTHEIESSLITPLPPAGLFVAYLSPPPTLTAATDSEGRIAVTDNSATGTATVSGTSNAIGQTIEIDLNQPGDAIGFATVAADGSWEASFSDSGITATSTLYISTTSSLGTPTEILDSLDIYAAPAVPVLTGPTLSSNDTYPFITGEGSPDETVTFINALNGATLGTTEADSEGAFDFLVGTPLAEGTYQIYAIGTNDAGGISAPSSLLTFTIDLTPPAELVTGLTIADDDVVTLADQVQGTMTVTGSLSATLAAGDSIVLSLNGESITVPADPGATSFSIVVPVASGPGAYSAVVEDQAGNVTAATTQNFSYASTNQLTEFTTPGATAGFAEAPSLSQDGQFIAYAGGASNGFDGAFVAANQAETYSYSDIYLANTQAGTAIDVTGGEYNATAPSLSGDGSLVAFTAYDTTDTASQVFVVDTATDTATLVSHDMTTLTLGGNNFSQGAAISEDGNAVAFYSNASNLTQGSTSGTQVYEADLATGAVRLVSGLPGSLVADGYSYDPSISADGSLVVFSSNADNLAASAPDNGTFEVYATDFDANGQASVSLVSQTAAGVAADNDGATDASLSADGRYVVFVSDADNLVAGVTGDDAQVYRADLQTGAIILVSALAGVAGDSESEEPRISDDGNVVVFDTYADNLVSGTNGETAQVVEANISTGVLTLASGAGLAGADADSTDPAISGDGKVVAFDSFADNLVAGYGSSSSSAGEAVYTSEPIADAACYCRGTHISTARGEVPIEALAVGDFVITQSGALRPVVWLGHRRVDCTRHPDPGKVWPIRILRDAVAPGQPARDLWISPGHAIAAEGILIPAMALLNGATIAQCPTDRVEYWHVELATHDVILAEGLAAESYLDTGSRSSFVGGKVLQLHPDFAPDAACEAIWEAAGCAPMRMDGPLVARVDRRLRQRAKALGHGVRPAKQRPHAARTTDLIDLLRPDFYTATHGDVAASGIDPFRHYARWGLREGRLPCPERDLISGLGLVDSGTAAVTMADVIIAGEDTVGHFCRIGWRERRRPNAYFDTGWYLDTHDVPAGMNPLLHYVLIGEARGLPPSRHFDPKWYRTHYDLSKSDSPLAHYLQHRRGQRLSPRRDFDVGKHLDSSSAPIRPGRDPYAHYLARGQQSGIVNSRK